MEELAIPKGKKLVRPTRQPDLISKRGVPYWFGPEWIRATNYEAKSFGRIIPVADKGETVRLHMLSSSGTFSYIQGSIQEEFKEWLSDRSGVITPWREGMELDCLLLGVTPEEILSSDWTYE